ncbi:MAG: hypothetical protein HONBIEJF_01103 [Fimbriimonadaceae bacterium]|nr:hypothetical protein [Fimbriimonadaceae bacterium]
MTTGLLVCTVYCQVSGGPFGLEELVKEVGPAIAIALILLTPLVWALPDALTTCELAPALPEEGGYIIWVRRALGPFWGFVNAWWSWLYAIIDAAIYPVLFTSYLSGFLTEQFGIKGIDLPAMKWLVAVIVVGMFAYLNIRGTKQVGIASAAFAGMIVLPFLIMAGIAGWRYAQAPTPFLPPLQTENLWGSLSGGLAIVMWNYLGWDALSTIAEEVDEPQKAYPRAMLFGIVAVTGVYLIATLAGLAFVPDPAKWEEGAWPMIASVIGGPWLGMLMLVAGAISMVALYTGTLLGASRVPFVLARERYLPQGLVAIHPRFGTPYRAILLCAVIHAVLVAQTFQDLVRVNVILYGCALVLESLSLIVLRKNEPNLHRPFRIWGGMPFLFAIVTMPILLVGLLIAATVIDPEERATMVPTALIIASGPLVYYAIQRLRRRAG